MELDPIRLSRRAREQLIRLKRVTGLKHWHELCRWAFCASLAEPSAPALMKLPMDVSIEMTWKTFGGPYEEIYLALLKARCRRDGLGTSEEVLSTQLRLHLHRGIGDLSADRRMRDIKGLLKRLPLGI